MDLLDRFLAQMGELDKVWMPFLVAIVIVAIGIWRAMQWRYGSTAEQLREDRDYWKGMAARSVGTDAELVKQQRLAAKEARASARYTVPKQASLDDLTMSDLALAKFGEDTMLPDNITAAFLFGLCEGKTDIQCEGAVEIYLGQRLKVSGKIYAATSMGSATTISIGALGFESHHDIYMIFEGDRERLRVMQLGGVLTATGRITYLSASSMKLADCRLV